MSRFVNTDIPFFLNNGEPNALGTVYFGEPNTDAKANPKVPYLDAALTTPATATQSLTAGGKLQQELYLNGPYSIIVDDADGVQVDEDQDIQTYNADSISITIKGLQRTSVESYLNNKEVADYTELRGLPVTQVAVGEKIWVRGFPDAWEKKSGWAALSASDNGWYIVPTSNTDDSYYESTAEFPTSRIFGTSNNPADTANLQAFIDFCGNNQRKGILTEGGHAFNADLQIPRNCVIEGIGHSFGSTLIPYGNARIVFRGDLEPGGFVFHASLKNIAVNASQSTLSASELFYVFQSYSIDLAVRVENLNTASSNNRLIRIEDSNNINLYQPILFGTSNSNGQAIFIGDDSTVNIHEPDLELINKGIVVDGNAGTTVNVYGIYAERYITCIEHASTSLGLLNLYGGVMNNPSASAVGATLNAKTRVYGTDVDLNGGTGYRSSIATRPDVEFYGVDESKISGDFLTGSTYTRLKNGVYEFENSYSFASSAHDAYQDVVVIENTSANMSSIVEIEYWATSNGLGRAFKRDRLLVVKESGGAFAASLIDSVDMTNQTGSNYTIAVTLNVVTASNTATLQVKQNSTGGINSGQSANLYARIKVLSVDSATEVR